MRRTSSGKSYRVLSHSSLDYDKRVRHKRWLTLSLAINAVLLLAWLFSRKAVTPSRMDMYVCSLRLQLCKAPWLTSALTALYMQWLQWIIERVCSEHFAAEQGPEGIVNLAWDLRTETQLTMICLSSNQSVRNQPIQMLYRSAIQPPSLKVDNDMMFNAAGSC